MKMANEVDRTKKTGFCDMSKKATGLGTPRNTMGGKAGSVDKADQRGKNESLVR